MKKNNFLKLTTSVLILLFLFSTHGFAQLQLQKTATSGGSAILTDENSGEWLRWDDGINHKAFSGPKIWWTSAIYFDTYDLADYDGWHVTKIEVYQNHLAHEGLIKIWQGHDINNLTEYVSQTLPMKENTWHKIVLDRPHFIDASRKLVFGVEWDDIGDWHFPAGVQGKYPPQYKGEMIMYGVYPGTWQYLCTDKGFCNTWNKAIYVEYLETYTVTFEITDANTGEDIDDGVITLDNKTNEPGDYIFDNILPGNYEYIVEAESYFTYEGEVEVIDADVTVEVEMEHEVYTVTFMVEDSKTEEPIVNATVTFDGEEYMTDNDGMAVIEDVYLSVYDYTVEKEGYVTVAGEVEVVDDITVEVSMIPEYYYPLVEEDKVWKVFENYIWYGYTVAYTFEKENNINREPYYRVLKKKPPLDQNNWYTFGYIREDSLKQVFFLKNNNNEEEILIYDFNLEIGDYFHLLHTVYNIDSIKLTNNELRRRWMFTGGYERWIEGIGSDYGGLFYHLNHWERKNIKHIPEIELLCFYQDDELLYQHELYDTCDYSFSNVYIQEISHSISFFEIYPNPFQDKIYIKNKANTKIDKILIYDNAGILIWQKSTPRSDKLDLSFLKNGVYFMQIHFNNKSKTIKLIKL